MMHKLRVWLPVFCTDYTGRIYRDVYVPAVPRASPKEEKEGEAEPCDFLLSGLFHPPVFVRTPYRMLYTYGQPEEQLFDPCYDISTASWHATIAGHRFVRTWDEAMAGPYRDWIVVEKVAVATKNTCTSNDVAGVMLGPAPVKVAGYVPVASGKFKPIPDDQDQDLAIGESIVWEATGNIHRHSLTRFYHALARPEAVRYLAAKAANHTDPDARVLGLLQNSGMFVKGIESKLAKILKYYASPARLQSDPVLRVSDLAGKTHWDIDMIYGVGPLTIASLVAAGLITLDKYGEGTDGDRPIKGGLEGAGEDPGPGQEPASGGEPAGDPGPQQCGGSVPETDRA